MATNFPTGLDSFNNPTTANRLSDIAVLHSSQHANTNDAIEALELKLGVNLSSSEFSIDYISKLFLLTENQHPSARYREISYHPTIRILPISIIWYVDNSKVIKLVEKSYVYGGSVAVLPSSVSLTLFDGSSGNNILRTIQDIITYEKVFEVSRTRTVT